MSCYRLELTGLPSPAVVAIKTSSNEAYEMVKRGRPDDVYELIDSPPRGPPRASQEGMYEVPSAPPCHYRLPAIPPPVGGAGEKEEEDAVYETIPGDT